MIPGFSTILSYGPSYEIKAEDAYLCALLFTYELASDGWDPIIDSGFEGYMKEVNGVTIAIGSLAAPDDPYQLQNKHLVVGLLRLMNSLASRTAFCNAIAALYVYHNLIGQVAVVRRLTRPSLTGVNGTSVGLMDTTPVANVVTASRSLTVPREIVDPEDSSFVISYEMLEDPISCQALLNAALNALANTAAIENEYPCTNFMGLSSSGEVTYSINRNPPGTARLRLTYGLVKTALKLLPARLYIQNSCGEVKFDLIYAGEELGGGTFFLT